MAASVDIDHGYSGYTHRIDTAMRRINFDFDTLDITIQRHAPDTIGTIRRIPKKPSESAP